VKTNVGHLEAAAGVAGLLKAIGVLRSRQIPKNLHFERPNPNIPFAELGLEIVAEATPLPSAADKPTLFVGVNSFGYGGTNAHVVLQSAPSDTELVAASERQAPPSQPLIVPLSARSPEALRDLASRMSFQLGRGAAIELADVAFSAAFHRSHLDYRAAIVAADVDELRGELGALALGQTTDALALGEGVSEAPGWVFAYTGMGPQWWGLGRELIETDRQFAEAIDDVDRCFRAVSGWSVKEAMLASEAESRMARTDVAQPASFALQVALTRYYQARGVSPVAIVGHSGGEVAAAHVAGVYSLEESARIIYHRSRLQQSLALRGGMLAVAMPRAEAKELCAGYPGVSIAAVNSESALTLSGDRGELEQIAKVLSARESFHRLLRVEVAYHSAHMDEIEHELIAVLSDLVPREPNVPLYSAAYGQRAPAAAWGPRYWWQSSRDAVLFADAVQALLAAGHRHFLELGPHPVLVGFIKECAAERGRSVTAVASLERKKSERVRLARSLAELYVAGHDPDFRVLLPGGGRRIELPRYAWQRQPLWIESERSRMDRLGLPGPVYLNRSLVGVADAWDVELNRAYFPFLHEHRLRGETVFAGMAYVDAALALHQRLAPGAGAVLQNTSFDQLLVIDATKLQRLIVRREAEGRFDISSRVEGEEEAPERHSHGRFHASTEEAPRVDLAAHRARCPERVPIDVFYRRLSNLGLHYGPWFRPTTELWVGGDHFFATLDGSRFDAQVDHPLHPALFDAAIQPILYCTGGSTLYVPRAIRQLTWYRRPSGAMLYAYGQLHQRHEAFTLSEVWLTDAEGRLHAHADGILAEALPADASSQALWHDVIWSAATLDGAAGEEPRGVQIVSDGSEAQAALATALHEALPDSRVLVQRARSGFDKERWGELLEANASGDRLSLIVLVTGEPDGDDTPLAVTAAVARIIGLLQALAARPEREIDVTFVSRGAKAVTREDGVRSVRAAASFALGLVAANEHEALICRAVDLDDEPAPASAARIALEIKRRTRGEIAYRGGRRHQSVLNARATSRDAGETSPRPTGIETPVDDGVELCASPRSDEVLFFRRLERRPPGPGEIEVRIERAGINDKDLLQTLGGLSPIAFENTRSRSWLGNECAGRVVRVGAGSRFHVGQPVLALHPRTLASHVTLSEAWAAAIPEPLSMEAAAIPFAYVTAYRALVDLAHVQPGERVLIHGAASDLGQALIAVARQRGAEIWATAGTEQRGELLSHSGIAHVFSSRELEFVEPLRRASEARGMDVVVGAVFGPALHASLELLDSGGRYVDVGKRDIVEDAGLPMRSFNRNLTYTSLDIDRLQTEHPALVQRTLRCVLELFARGELRLGTTRVYPATEARAAFEAMRERRQIGKLLVDFSSGSVPVRDDAQAALVRRDACYLVTGGTSGFGATIARWLAEQGAGRLILVSRSGPAAPGADELRRELEARGSAVEILSVDVCRLDQVREAVGRAQGSALPLRGVIHGAMVLEDESLARLREDGFARVFEPKVLGAMNLCQALSQPERLDFLVFQSSVSALVGNPGQASYAAANATLDAFAHSLRGRGVPALSINWGALADSGVIARDERLQGTLTSAGASGISDRDALAFLHSAIRAGTAQVGAFSVDWNKWSAAHPKLLDEPRFASLRRRSQPEDDVPEQLRRLLESRSPEERRAIVQRTIAETVARVLRLGNRQLAPSRKLNQLGMDSLLVLELSVALQQRTGVRFSTLQLLKGPTLEQLTELTLGRLCTGDRHGDSARSQS
jgi:NADPH:quinone reductase-like Zn-dependent oxidoreductase/malonyl CoA-acyl carrier protein transacylase/NAD(P)-dependent dehydrogenase (short-subunit alcohol dehydrogenase family)